MFTKLAFLVDIALFPSEIGDERVLEEAGLVACLINDRLSTLG